MDRYKLIWAILLLALLIVNGTALAVSDVIRLHVIANSDTPEDQEIKDKVRDEIVLELGGEFQGLSQSQVEAWISENTDRVAGIAMATLKEHGIYQDVKVEFGVTEYPTRAYGPLVYPAGKYRSLRIVLGEGDGENWWCLIFPPLCFVEEASASGQDMEEDDREVRFWIVDKLRGLWSRIRGA